MKKILILLVSLTVFASCKNDKKSEQKEEITISDDAEKNEAQSDELTLLKGEFVYYGGAAVLQTHNEIYGVLITNKMLELNKLAKKYKKEPTDMVYIEVKGKVTTQEDEKILWKKKVKIVEILFVNPSPKEDSNIVKLGN